MAEPSAFRRHVATALGLQAEPEDDAWRLAKSWGMSGNRGADLVFQTRAHGGSLHLALRALRPQGTVIDLVFYHGGMADTRLGEEFHHNRISIIGSQISGVAPALQHRWDEMRMSRTVLALERAGQLRLTELVTHTFAADQAPAAFEMLDLAAEPSLQVVLEYGTSR